MRKIKFKEVSLENFKCHSKLKIDLSNNELILITGNNGTGKTSVIEAILYCLLDKTTTGLRGDDVITKKVGKNCSVIVKATVDDDEYEIRKYRKHKKFKNSKFIIKNGKDISPVDLADCNEMIKNIFFTEDIFCNCLLFSNYIKNPFLASKHSDQKDLLDKILSLEKYDVYLQNVKELISTEEQNLEKLNSNIQKYEFEIDHFTELIESTKEEYKNYITNVIKKKNEELAINLKNLLKEKDSINIDDNYIKDLNEQERKNNDDVLSINNKLLNIKTEIENKINEETYKIDKIKNNDLNILKDKSNIKLKYINDEINEIESKIQEEKNKQLELMNSLDVEYNNSIEKIYDRYNEKTLSLNSDLDTINSNILKYTTAINVIDNNINNNLNEIKLINNTIENDTCPTCNQKMVIKNLDELNKNKISLKNKNDKLIIKKNKLNSELNNINNKKLEITKSLKEIDSFLNSEKLIEQDKLDKNKKELTTKLNEKINEFNTLLSEKCDNRNKIEELVLNKTNEINTKYSKLLDSNINDVKDEYKKIAIELSENKKVLEDKQRIILTKIEEQNNLKIKLNELCNKINIIENNINTNKELAIEKKEDCNEKVLNYITKIDETKNKIKDDIKIKEDKNKEIDILNFWKTAFGDVGIKSLLLDDAIPILNSRAIELCEMIDNLRIRFNSQTLLKSGKFNDKFDVEVVHSKNLSEFKELSSGETRLVNIIVLLCLRHLLEKMSGVSINLLLLDEILDSLDETNSEIIVNLLKELSNDYCILLISHTHKQWIQANQVYNF